MELTILDWVAFSTYIPGHWDIDNLCVQATCRNGFPKCTKSLIGHDRSGKCLLEAILISHGITEAKRIGLAGPIECPLAAWGPMGPSGRTADFFVYGGKSDSTGIGHMFNCFIVVLLGLN